MYPQVHMYVSIYIYIYICLFQQTNNQQEQVSFFFTSDIFVAFLIIIIMVKQGPRYLIFLVPTTVNKPIMLILSSLPEMQNELNDRIVLMPCIILKCHNSASTRNMKDIYLLQLFTLGQL